MLAILWRQAVAFTVLAKYSSGPTLFNPNIEITETLGSLLHRRDRGDVPSTGHAEIQALPEQTPIFKNRRDAMMLLTGWAIPVPLMPDPGTRWENPACAKELAKLQRERRDRDGVVVYLKRTVVRGQYLMSEEELKRHVPLRLLNRAPGKPYV